MRSRACDPARWCGCSRCCCSSASRTLSSGPRHLRSALGHARIRGQCRCALPTSSGSTCGWRWARSGAALIVALPLGVLCHRVPRLRAGVLGTLNLIQTIPAIALFGILMAPLAALAAAVPLAGGARHSRHRHRAGADRAVSLFACCRWWPIPCWACSASRRPRSKRPAAWA